METVVPTVQTIRYKPQWDQLRMLQFIILGPQNLDLRWLHLSSVLVPRNRYRHLLCITQKHPFSTADRLEFLFLLVLLEFLPQLLLVV